MDTLHTFEPRYDAEIIGARCAVALARGDHRARERAQVACFGGGERTVGWHLRALFSGPRASCELMIKRIHMRV